MTAKPAEIAQFKYTELTFIIVTIYISHLPFLTSNMIWVYIVQFCHILELVV